MGRAQLTRLFTAVRIKEYSRRFYAGYIAPRHEDPDVRNRELVLNVLLVASLILVSTLFLLVIISLIALSNDYVLGRVIVNAIVCLFIGGLYLLSRRGYYAIAAYLLVITYYVLATMLIWNWGLNLPTGVLLYGLFIVLAGILLRAQRALYAAGIVCMTLIGLQLLEDQNVHQPDTSWIQIPSTYGDVLAYSIMFLLLATVSWLFNRQMEYSLKRARIAERALLKRKESLEEKVAERTRDLEQSQFEKLEQLQRFAVLGQLSAGVVHDLANHLSSLTLDIESLKSEQQSHDVRRARQSIRYIDKMVDHLRRQLQGTTSEQNFNLLSVTKEVLTLLRSKAEHRNIIITINAAASDHRRFRVYGDVMRFRQLIAILVNNAIDAYESSSKATNREIVVTVNRHEHTIELTVSDWGKGIATAERERIFDSFYTTKSSGMGIGLFVGKQIVEDSGGTIVVKSYNQPTTIGFTLPEKK